MSVRVSFETAQTVLRFACLTEDRTDVEQRSLLALAFAADIEHNRATTTNRRFRVGEPSDLVGLVDSSRELQPDDKRVWLTEQHAKRREHQCRVWRGGGD